MYVCMYTGDSQTFTLSVKPSKDYPLDVYFLMDLSGSLDQDLATIQNISGSISALNSHNTMSFI